MNSSEQDERATLGMVYAVAAILIGAFVLTDHFGWYLALPLTASWLVLSGATVNQGDMYRRSSFIYGLATFTSVLMTDVLGNKNALGIASPAMTWTAASFIVAFIVDQTYPVTDPYRDVRFEGTLLYAGSTLGLGTLFTQILGWNEYTLLVAMLAPVAIGMKKFVSSPKQSVESDVRMRAFVMYACFAGGIGYVIHAFIGIPLIPVWLVAFAVATVVDHFWIETPKPVGHRAYATSRA